MSFPVRKRLPHDVPAWVPDGSAYFITICAAERGGDMLIREAGAEGLCAAARHYHEISRWHVRLFLVMPDHIHALLAFSGQMSIRKVIASWKSFTAKSTGIRWQRDFFEHRLRADESLDEKAAYIRNNPVRAGLCKTPEDWPHFWPR